MFIEFQQAYGKLEDDELLRLASDRSSLTDEAKLALDTEMHSRNLTVADVTTHETLVKKNEQRESRNTRRKLFGSRRGVMNWVRFGLWFLLLMFAVALVTVWLAER